MGLTPDDAPVSETDSPNTSKLDIDTDAALRACASAWAFFDGAEANLPSGVEALHMALDMAEVGHPISGAWVREAHALLQGVDGASEESSAEVQKLIATLHSPEFEALPPIEQAARAHCSVTAETWPGETRHRLAAVVASVYLIRDSGLPAFVPIDQADAYRDAVAAAQDNKPEALVRLLSRSATDLKALVSEPVPESVDDLPVDHPPVDESSGLGDPLPEVVEAVANDEGDALPAAESPEDVEAGDEVEEGDALPADLDVSAYVGQYTFPDIHRRRIPGYIYLGVATACFALWISRRGHDPVLVNTGFIVAAFGFLLVGWYHLATAWPLDVSDTDALQAAAREVGFPVGHASAQLGWRGLRSRPTWRILVYSNEDPPTTRGLVLVDGTDGQVLSHFTETNPEDWSVYSS